MPSDSLCKECVVQGWAPQEDYDIDVEVSKMWPDWIRNFYKQTVDTAVDLVQKNIFWKYFFLTPAFCYIQLTNMVYRKQYTKLVYLFPFLASFLVAAPVAILIDQVKEITK